MSRKQLLVLSAFTAQVAAIGGAVIEGENIDHEAAELSSRLQAATDEQAAYLQIFTLDLFPHSFLFLFPPLLNPCSVRIRSLQSPFSAHATDGRPSGASVTYKNVIRPAAYQVDVNWGD